MSELVSERVISLRVTAAYRLYNAGRRLQRGHELGGHSLTHSLTRFNPDVALMFNHSRSMSLRLGLLRLKLQAKLRGGPTYNRQGLCFEGMITATDPAL